MKCFVLSVLLGTFLLSVFSFAQAPLSDEQVLNAINRAFTEKGREIGLTLNDVQTNLLSGIVCKTCQTTGYTIFVYTPESWIELKAVQARREMLPFAFEDVTTEMRLPYIHVLASPSRPEYLSGSGMAMASSVHRVVLSSTNRGDVVQPLSESHSAVENNSAFRSFTQASAGAVFSLEDVKRLRAEDPKGEFFIVVVGDNQNKYFKVKTKFFNQLFGHNADTLYAQLKTPGATTARMSSNRNTVTGSAAGTQISEPQPVKEIDVPHVPDSNRRTEPGEYHHISQENVIRLPAPTESSDIQDSDVGNKKPAAEPAKFDAVAATRTPSRLQNKASAKASSHQYDGFAHDNALIAQWWNIRESDVKNSFASPAQSSVAQAASTADVANGTSQASIGAASNEKPTIMRDGVRVDHITPNGPADQAGLQVGDDILAVDGIYLFRVRELMEAVRRYSPGATVSLRYRRRSTIYDTFVVITAETMRSEQPAIESAE